MARLRTRAASGTEPQYPIGHWKTTTFVGALRLDGMTTPMVLDGAMVSLSPLMLIRYWTNLGAGRHRRHGQFARP